MELGRQESSLSPYLSADEADTSARQWTSQGTRGKAPGHTERRGQTMGKKWITDDEIRAKSDEVADARLNPQTTPADLKASKAQLADMYAKQRAGQRPPSGWTGN